MRPGRLDRILYVDAPDQAARHEIFRIRLGNMAVEPNVAIEPLASVVRYPLPISSTS
jgi:ATP-dependent 26S proteasome regulatory subunit